MFPRTKRAPVEQMLAAPHQEYTLKTYFHGARSFQDRYPVQRLEKVERLRAARDATVQSRSDFADY